MWGCEHEKVALESYIKKSGHHTDIVVSESGLVIDASYPHMGASPDGIVTCACCGRGVIEIKCPYSCRDKTFLEATGDYYQVQAEMKFCQCLYCDFFVWSEEDIVIERIVPDIEFIESALEKATMFFKYGQNYLESTTPNCHPQLRI